MTRITPITGKADVPAEQHHVVDEVVKVFGNVRGPFSVMLKSPKLAERVLPLVTFFREGSVVEAKLRSHAILAAVREREVAYVWSAQVGAARRAGVPDATIDLIRAKGDPAALPADERDVVDLYAPADARQPGRPGACSTGSKSGMASNGWSN